VRDRQRLCGEVRAQDLAESCVEALDILWGEVISAI
jgi:hypothetical protein